MSIEQALVDYLVKNGLFADQAIAIVKTFESDEANASKSLRKGVNGDRPNKNPSRSRAFQH